MRYLSYHPTPPLTEFIEAFWLIEGGDVPRKEVIFPTGTTELVINLHEDEIHIDNPARPVRGERFSGAVVSGMFSHSFLCDARQHRAMIGVHFKPGGAFPLLGAMASDLMDAHVDLESLWGRTGSSLRHELCSNTTPQQKFRELEAALLGRLGSARLHSAVRAALQMFGPSGTGRPVREVAREVGLSQRRFIQLFTAQVGLTPKRLCRVLRFQRARVAGQGSAEHFSANWAQIAVACGYSDQAHLIRDFQEFAGLTPNEYLRLSRSHPELKDNHVPLRGVGVLTDQRGPAVRAAG